MQWDAIQLEAKRRGALVYAIDQAQTPPMTQPGPWGDVHHGYCAGLAANWIGLAYQGKDFPYSGQVCDNPPWQSTEAQTIDANTGFSTWLNEWKVIMATFQCTVSGLQATQAHSPSAAFICQVVFRAYGCYGVSLRRNAEGSLPPGGHMVAMCNGRDGRLHLFDGNYFHIAIKDPCVFQDFVSWWLKETGYAKRYTVLTGVTGIRPPVNHTHP